MNFYYTKKVISLFLVMTILLSILSLSSFATSEKAAENVVRFADGCYFVTVMIEEQVTPRATTVTKTKRTVCYDANDVAKCALEVTATFSLNKGTSITCTNATYKTYSYASGWSIESPSVKYDNYISSAVAKASGTVKHKVLGVTVKTEPISVSLSGYKDGTYV